MKWRGPQSGLSLVELMVAISIGLVIVLGITQVFVSSKRGYRVQESAIRLQDNGRVAVAQISSALRMADFWGGISANAIGGNPNVSGQSGSSCTATWILDWEQAVHGYDGVGADAPLDCIPNTNYVANSDVLVVRYTDSREFLTDADVDDMDADDPEILLRVASGRNGFMFNRNGADSNSWANAKAQIARQDPASDDGNGVANYPYRLSVYFLRPCSTQDTCSATSDGGRPIPTLVALELTTSGTSMQLRQLPLVEGVEQMQIEYGVDFDNDQIVDRYQSASDLVAADWPRVIACRIGLMVRGDELDSFADAATYTLPGGFNFTATGTAQRYQRRPLVVDLQIRNRIRN